MKIEDALEQLRKSEKRKFEQTYDLVINLKNIDLKKPENKISKELVLPHRTGKNVSVFVFSDKTGFDKARLEEISNNKKDIKNLVQKNDFFLATPELMPLIGKSLGRYLAPAGKMPQPLPPNASKDVLDGIIKRKQNAVKLRIRNMPTFQVPVGKESMDANEVRENVETVLKEAISALPKGRAQIRNVSLKLTMSEPVRIDF